MWSYWIFTAIEGTMCNLGQKFPKQTFRMDPHGRWETRDESMDTQWFSKGYTCNQLHLNNESSLRHLRIKLECNSTSACRSKGWLVVSPKNPSHKRYLPTRTLKRKAVFELRLDTYECYYGPFAESNHPKKNYSLPFLEKQKQSAILKRDFHRRH